MSSPPQRALANIRVLVHYALKITLSATAIMQTFSDNQTMKFCKNQRCRPWSWSSSRLLTTSLHLYATHWYFTEKKRRPMVPSRPRTCRYGIPSHTVPLSALNFPQWELNSHCSDYSCVDVYRTTACFNLKLNKEHKIKVENFAKKNHGVKGEFDFSVF